MAYDGAKYVFELTMCIYGTFDQPLVDERVAQFRDQTRWFLGDYRKMNFARSGSKTVFTYNATLLCCSLAGLTDFTSGASLAHVAGGIAALQPGKIFNLTGRP